MEERENQEEEQDQEGGGTGGEEEEWKATRRKTCGSCGRPARVCLCSHLPAAPINTTTTVIILQHPLETRHPLSTVPVITRCLHNAHVIVSRRLSPGSSPILDSLCSSPSGSRHSALVLFPDSSYAYLINADPDFSFFVHDEPSSNFSLCSSSTNIGWYPFIVWENRTTDFTFNPHENKFTLGLLVVMRIVNLLPSSGADSCDLADWVSAQFSSEAAGHEVHHEPLYLIVFDATWKHAKEMVKGSLPFLSKFSRQVSLPVDASLEGSSIYDSDLILRKEPFSGCMSTMEAVARSLRLLELDGAEIEQKLLSVLRAMVAFQACNLKPMKPRPRLVKQSKSRCFLSN